MKYASLAFRGAFGGCLIAPALLDLPQKVDGQGSPLPLCGMPVIGAMFRGAFLGTISGALIGAAVAYWRLASKSGEPRLPI
jgi:hypothetical protein